VTAPIPVTTTRRRPGGFTTLHLNSNEGMDGVLDRTARGPLARPGAERRPASGASKN